MTQVNRVYEIADILQVPLDRQGDKVKGQLQVEMALGPLRFPFTMKVVSSFVCAEAAAALVRVSGNLYLLVGTSPEGSTLVLVDVSKVKGGLGAGKLDGCTSLQEANQKMAGACAAAFLWDPASVSWGRVAAP